ncbi:helicase-exonuclease AddAB subunit AddA [Paenibacillus aurantius]|uniref:ATP-dependent helicase/nuclease subunit A n=1 Tax=Paenibacillus aurantius TaxID=2918900 RepID=A0AA96LHK2_9BACL|nr:helicase-exonuclease AddAB subunit AddA [Paenibacillus aurantius]WNQ13448.1 helicase-exonuclease AddAB subunit AddA [Paenibacillus aurantius]
MTSVIPKPADSTWTNEQWDAISLSGENILVAAAAGSGKTAVLVERIIRKLSDETDPMDVDRLLVATFTKAAASEMKQRIREALSAALEKSPDSAHLRSQLALLNKASITTLHSFCLEVIQRHYQVIRLDPGFRIGNETETALMRQELLEELMEENYEQAEEDSPFWRLVDWFSGERSDAALFRLLLQLYDSSRSHPYPEHWLKEMAGLFGRHDEEEVGASGQGYLAWQESLASDVRLELNGMAGLLKEAVRIAEGPGGPAPYLTSLQEELAAIEARRAAARGSWEDMYQAFQDPVFGRLKACKGDEYDKALQDKVKALRDSVKERLGKLQTDLFGRTEEQFRQELEKTAPLMTALVELVLAFGERYQTAKRKKGLVDFADLEHYCLQILTGAESVPGRLVPSEAAAEYREHYLEILLDEYQDTNRVQEAIVELISRDGKGNRFMVGDVKQSIYRFRLAEPGLFLEKYKRFGSDGTGGGRRIDLARNFRSRQEVVDGVNFLFRQIMEEQVGEIRYDPSAELVCGASYPPNELDLSVELLLVDKAGQDEGKGTFSPDEGEESGGADSESADEQSAEKEEQAALLEARLIASRIRSLMGETGPRFLTAGRKGEPSRPLEYRDIVILMRATQQWAGVFMEEFKREGIPVYAELNSGYFAATEVGVILSLLQIIDNPFQDIPLAGVLRSPIVGLTADELARIRAAHKNGSFYEALLAYSEAAASTLQAAAVSEQASLGDRLAGFPGRSDTMAGIVKAFPGSPEPELAAKLSVFLDRLSRWREEARQAPVSDLIGQLYRETGYFDFTGGLPGGSQRQANLRALYDRARQYEATSFRGLFRFLRFIERMRDGGGDLGTARALGEQENVVRIMTIHKSKGLEFPVVFVAGTGKMFNRQDLNGGFLLHKDLGFGPRFVDTELRVSYPTLPSLAIRRRMKMELLAEEMRVLYVALTRAREKLYLTGTVKSLESQAANWARMLGHKELVLPDYELAQAKCYLDWIGPALIRHRDASLLRKAAGEPEGFPAGMAEEPSRWSVTVVPAWKLSAVTELADGTTGQENSVKLEAVTLLLPVTGLSGRWKGEIDRRLSWEYPYAQASRLFSKTSVSELKRLSEQREAVLSGDDDPPGTAGSLPGTGRPVVPAFRRPKFMEEKKLTAAERGTVYHAVMQLLPLKPGLSRDDIEAAVQDMVTRRLLLPEQAQAIDPGVIAAFFATEAGTRLLGARQVHRELPFNYRMEAGELHPDEDERIRRESVMIQGIIDCLFEDEEGLVLLDYKTDALRQGEGSRAERYRTQISLYARAVEDIWKRPLSRKYLYFFDGAELVTLD